METLLEGHYNIIVVNRIAEAKRKTKNEYFDLIIALTDSITESDSAIRRFINGEDLNKKIPVLLMNPEKLTVELFFRWLNRGMGHHINNPYQKEYLITSIRELINSSNPKDAKNERICMEIKSDKKKYSLKLGKAQLRDFLVSTIRNAVQQNLMIQKAREELTALNENTMRDSPEDIVSAGNRKSDGLKKELIAAFENEEFTVYYQPIVSLKRGKIAGFEALARWEHPSRGLVKPDAFIPHAEETGLIIPLGNWIIEKSVGQLKKWHETFHSDPSLSISINLSAVQFRHEGLYETIEEIVARYRVPPDTIKFEITESALMEDKESANMMLLKLKAMGFQICMDDFGTGYSSLSYLRHFPVDILKIDKSFVRWMGFDDESEVIVQIIVQLAHFLHMQVIAEGIENQEHYRKLSELSCEYGQGYLFSKPIDARSAEELLRSETVWNC